MGDPESLGLAPIVRFFAACPHGVSMEAAGRLWAWLHGAEGRLEKGASGTHVAIEPQGAAGAEVAPVRAVWVEASLRDMFDEYVSAFQKHGSGETELPSPSRWLLESEV
eukprot:5558235-Pleurochrysis_carterae.AAC.1